MWPQEKKYDPLNQYLLFSGQGHIVMTFKDIEAILDKPLPLSARRRPEWWSNSLRGHTQAQAWRNAGYKTSRIDLPNETIEFKLEDWPEGYTQFKWPLREVTTRPKGFEEADQSNYAVPVRAREHPLFGIWEGKVTLLPDFDYTLPAFDADDAA